MAGMKSLFGSIQGKIILQMMLVSLVPIIIIAAIVYFSMFSSQRSASDSVDETRAEMQEKVVAPSLENQAKAMSLEMTGTVGSQILDLIQIMTATMMIGFDDTSSISMYLFSQLMILDDYNEFTLTDPEGIVLATTNTELSPGDDLSSESWWANGNLLSIVPVEGNQEMEMIVWLPISTPMDPDQVLGTMIGVINMESDASTVEYAKQLEKGRMSVFYGGKLVADSGDLSRVFEERPTLSLVEQTAFQAVEEADAAMKAGDQFATVSGFVVDDEAGVVASYFRPGAEETTKVMPQVLLDINAETLNTDTDPSNQAVIVVMQQPKEVAFAPVASLDDLEDDLKDDTNTTLLLLLGVFISVTVIVLAIAVWLSRMITKPILDLHRGVEYVMAGNLNHRISSERTDEVGQLSLAFDMMTENIQRSQEELEDKVKGRTEELYSTAERMQVIIESMSDGLAVVDMTGTIVEANTALVRMHGFAQKEDLIGKNNMELIAVKDHDRVLVDMGETFEKRIPALHEYTMVKKDGSEYEAEMSTVALTDNQGNLTGAMAVIRDVTERKETEHQILEAKTKLEAYATDLERSNRELDDFAYIASHDLKEPLRGIYNFSSFLLEDYGNKLDDEGKEKLNTLMRLTQRLESYLNDLLYYSRAGRAELTKQEADSGEIVQEVLDTLKAEIAEQGTTVTVVDDMPVVFCDRAKLNEAIRNIISNAIKYNDKDEKWVEIGWQEGEDGKPVFFVRDNGIGIRDKHLDKVFKIFTRLHAKDKFGGGTGAGLTMTRKIIQRHGGDIWVESKEGEGTTFYFNLS